MMASVLHPRTGLNLFDQVDSQRLHGYLGVCTDLYAFNVMNAMFQDVSQLVSVVDHPIGFQSVKSVMARCGMVPPMRRFLLSQMATLLPESAQSRNTSILWQGLLSQCTEVDVPVLVEIFAAHASALWSQGYGVYMLHSLSDVPEDGTSALTTMLWDQLVVVPGDHEDDSCFLELATRTQGHRLLFRLMQTEAVKADLYKRVIRNSKALAQHSQGNYLVQQFLMEVSMEHLSDVLDGWVGSFALLACDKYASNVVEKCLRIVDRVWLDRMTHEFIAHIHTVITDRIGNFVLQTAAEVTTDGRMRGQLARAISTQIPGLRGHIQQKWMFIARSLQHAQHGGQARQHGVLSPQGQPCFLIPSPFATPVAPAEVDPDEVDPDEFDPVHEIQKLLETPVLLA